MEFQAELQNFFLQNRSFLGAVFFCFGALVGSFLNVVVYRLPKIMEKEWREQCCELLSVKPTEGGTEGNEEAIFNLALPASHCPSCQHVIRWWENLPVISFLCLKGRCSSCKAPISKRYPFIELLSALLSLTVALYLGFGAQALAGLLLTWLLLCLAAIDYDTQLLPDDITFPLIWLGLVLNLFSVFTSLDNAVIGAILGYLILWSVYWAFKLLTGKDGMGYGDFKLLAALGAWFGWQALPFIILCSSLVGAVVGISLMLFNKHDSQKAIPFGPYLAAAGWIYMLWGDMITTWYLSFY